MMHKALRFGWVGAFVGVLGACATRVDLNTIDIGPVVASHPPSNAGPIPATVPGGWRELKVPVDKHTVQSAYEESLTLALRFSDCAGDTFWAGDVYVAGRSLYQSRMADEEFAGIFGPLPEKMKLTAYLMEKDYQQRSPICAELSGGNMSGQTIRSQQYVLKPG